MPIGHSWMEGMIFDEFDFRIPYSEFSELCERAGI